MPETPAPVWSPRTATEDVQQPRIGPRLWMAGEFALCAFWSAVFLVAFNFAVTVAFYLVSGVWSWSLFSPQAQAYPTDALSRLAGSSEVRFMGGDPGFIYRTAVALVVCVGPVLVRAISAGSRYLLDDALLCREGLNHLLGRWAGVVAGVLVAGVLIGIF